MIWIINACKNCRWKSALYNQADTRLIMNENAKKKKEIPSQQYSCSYCVYKAQYPLAYYIPVKRKV